MTQNTKRTISEVLNYETGKPVKAEEFFKRPIDEVTVYRSQLQQAIQGIRCPLFACYYCKQMVRIRGGIAGPNKKKTEIFHFAHLKDSSDCHIKTNNKFTKDEVDRIKYNGAKESIIHQTLKENIAYSLRLNQNSKNEISNVEVEKIISDKVSKEWKKPDINALYLQNRIAIELQLSTTWLDVITSRQHFYKQQGIYIFWLFSAFNTNDDVRRLTYNDVVYTNNQNAYIFNKETFEMSKSANDLVIKCIYKNYYREEDVLCEDWKEEYITLSKLTFDEINFRIFYHDTDKQKKEVQKEIANYVDECEETERLELLRQKEEKRKQLEFERLETQKAEERENNRSELESKLFKFEAEIKTIEAKKSDSERNEQTKKVKLAEKNTFLLKVTEHGDKTIKYIQDNYNHSKPFYDTQELLTSLKSDFEKQILEANKSIATNKKEQAGIFTRLLAISKLKVINIAGAKYSNLDPATHWNFIKSNYTKVKVINDERIQDLFAEQELVSIKDERELNLLQFQKGILFLYDFTSLIEELSVTQKKNTECIADNEKELSLIKSEIENRIKTQLLQDLQQLENAISSHIKERAKWDIDLNALCIDIAQLKGQMNYEYSSK